ncbi:MAG TPA: AAA family ATPase [Phycisphaerales bacterium]|nr:AAA family ATPase [Phycisphaerales bacterium]
MTTQISASMDHASHPMLPGGVMPPDLGGVHHQQVNVVKLVHNLFRGRYLLTCGLAAIGLMLGVALGWLSRKPAYRAEAKIHIQPVIPKVMSTNDSVMPMFLSFVNTQANFLKEPRTIAAAMASPEWVALGRGNSPQAERAFRDSLEVRPAGRDLPEIIVVSFTDTNNTAAFVAVKEVCEAYQNLFGEGQGQEFNRAREAIIQEERRAIEQRVRDNQERLTLLAQQLGTGDAQQIQSFTVSKRINLQTEITLIERELISRGVTPPKEDSIYNLPKDIADAEQPAQDAAPDRKPGEMTFEEIAGVDPAMSNLLTTLRAAESEDAGLAAAGAGPGHRQRRNVRALIASTREQMATRKEEWLAGRPASAPAPMAAVGGPVESTERLLRRLTDTRRQLKEAFQEGSIIAGKVQEMENLRNEIAQANIKRQELVDALDDLRRETQMRGQFGFIKLYLPERIPALPSNDARIKFAAVFGFMGMMVPIVVIGIYGLTDRRYRYSDEALEEGPHNTPMLGILPRLPSDLSDAEQASAAAHCVHQIRTLLQISGRNRRVFAVTSSNPGDGKTSMALSLGLSFAGSGSRTLLVDMDMIGQGLSRGLKMREQSSLFEAIERGGILERIRPTHMENLSLLPTGVADDHRCANRLAEPMVLKLLETVRPEFDVVVIDTGPVLGSIEAHLVCAQADGVVLVVGAGRARGQVKSAVEQLHRVGARLMGLVFNLAQPKDFRTSAASQSFRSVRPDGGAIVPVPSGEFAELEPLPRVVALDTRR